MPLTHWHPTDAVPFKHRVAAFGAIAGLATPAAAQPVEQAQLSVQAVSDYRLRGISWSAGKPTLVAAAAVPVGTRNMIHATSFASRGGRRTGNADLGLRVGARHSEFVGPVRVDAGGSCRVFGTSDRTNFCEVEAGASFDLATATFHADLAYAPRQSAIGGDNLHAVAGASIAIPRLPVSAAAHVGRSTGRTDDHQAAKRLRPFGNYWDYGIGFTLAKNRLSLTGRYVGTAFSPSQSGRRSSGGLVAEARIDL